MKKVSVLMPTRNRYEMATKSIGSLFQNCKDINSFEVLLAVDNDDIETTRKLEEYILDKPNVRMIYFERQYYRGLHNYINHLALESQGTSLMLWNDDSTIESKDWEYEIIKNHDSFCVLSPKVQNMENFWRHQGVLFPVIPKEWIEITGEWAQVPACDSVIDVISKRLGILVQLESVVITHDRYENTGNNYDQTYVEVTADKTNSNYVDMFHVGKPEILELHYNKIKDYLHNKS